MKHLWILLFPLVFVSCGDGDSADNRTCVVDINQICTTNNEELDDEVAAADLECVAVGGDLAICGDPIDIDATISTDGELGDSLAEGRRFTLDADEQWGN